MASANVFLSKLEGIDFEFNERMRVSGKYIDLNVKAVFLKTSSLDEKVVAVSMFLNKAGDADYQTLEVLQRKAS